MLSWEYPPRIVGGISRVVHDLAQKLGEYGNEVHVVTCWQENTKEFEKDKNIFVHRVRILDNIHTDFIQWVHHLNFAMTEYCIRLFNDCGNFDIIHAHDWIVAFVSRILKNAYKVPLISTIHATEFGRNNGLHNSLQKYISSIEWLLTYESWRVICNSNYMKEELRYIFQLPCDKLRVIPNGVDINKFNGIERDYNFRRNYVSDNEKMVFFVGRLVQEKGVSILVDAIPKVLKYYNDAKFVIAGKGPQLEYLKNKAQEMGIAQKVYFTGYVSDENLLKLYKCADITVFPSLYEPFGIVALEGMIAGVPVVVSDTGGMGEIVNHGHDGMKAYVGNANSLADSILILLFDEELANKCVINALEKIKQMYTWDIISKQTLAVYEEVLSESKKSIWDSKSIKRIINISKLNFLQSQYDDNDTESYYESTYKNQ